MAEKMSAAQKMVIGDAQMAIFAAMMDTHKLSFAEASEFLRLYNAAIRKQALIEYATADLVNEKKMEEIEKTT